mmetsp:Transcript_36514/g.56682  ORF Transcript_36514/g.56682 Transcript_36514/m.56682 type:complete len:289 (-) Transcript_36514:41-907(-)
MTVGCVGGSSVKYSIKDLLSLRDFSASFQLDFVPANPEPEEELDADGEPVTKKPEILCFRKVVKRPNDIKFHCDMDVPADHIVHAYSLDRAVEWPHLNTFCAKTVGIKPLDIRMMRRQKPTQARLIFRSAEEALQFIAAVPPSARLKGSIPKFGIDTKAPKGSNFKDCFASVPVSAKEVSEIATSVATAVLWDKKSDVEVAAFAEVAEDDCCKKSKPASAFETTTAWAEPSKGLVESAVLVADGRGMAKAGTRSKQLAKQAGKKNTRNTKSVTAICVAHMPTTFAVDM